MLPSLTSPESSGPQVSGANAKRARSRWHWWLLGIGGAATAGALAVIFVKYGWWDEMIAMMENADPVVTLFLMATLPVAGFSISVVYVVAGLKFGLVNGGVAIAAVTAVHLVATHWIARSFLRAPVQRFLKRRNYHLPEAPAGAEKSLAGMVALVPGPPYFLRNYALALSGIPLRSYFWICLFVYTVRSYVTLALGDLAGDPDGERVLWLLGILAVKLTICAFLIRRIRERHRRLKARESTQAAPA